METKTAIAAVVVAMAMVMCCATSVQADDAYAQAAKRYRSAADLAKLARAMDADYPGAALMGVCMKHLDSRAKGESPSGFVSGGTEWSMHVVLAVYRESIDIRLVCESAARVLKN